MRGRPVTLLSILTCLSLLALSSGAMAADQYVDYDHSADFSAIKTFQMVDTSGTALAKANPLEAQRIHDQIVQHLTQLGLKEVTENPDEVVTYDATSKQNHVLTTMGGPVGFGFGWRRFGGMGMATTTESTFTEGTLVIDAYTPGNKQMLWRGIAEAAISENPQKTSEHVTKSLDKLFEKLAKVFSGSE